MTVTGAGKYSGTVSATFTIKAAEPGSTLDKSKLQALVDKVKGYNKADYQSGWDAFAVALADAQQVLQNSTDQQEVDKALSRLQSAADKLVKKSGDSGKTDGKDDGAQKPASKPDSALSNTGARYSVWVSPRSHCSSPPAPPTPSASARPELLAA